MSSNDVESKLQTYDPRFYIINTDFAKYAISTCIMQI